MVSMVYPAGKRLCEFLSYTFAPTVTEVFFYSSLALVLRGVPRSPRRRQFGCVQILLVASTVSNPRFCGGKQELLRVNWLGHEDAAGELSESTKNQPIMLAPFPSFNESRR